VTPLPNREAYPKKVVLRDGTPVELRPLERGDKIPLLRFFERIPEEERFFLKENVTAPQTIRGWLARLDFEQVFPIVAVAGGEIIGDATLHRSPTRARRHVGEVRIVVDPHYRERGLGRRLLRELLDIAWSLGLDKVVLELVARREKAAIMAALSVGFREAAVLRGWVRDPWGNYHDLVVLEMCIREPHLWWRH